MGTMGREGMEAPLPDAENPAEELASYRTVQRGVKKLGRCIQYQVVENPAIVLWIGC
jgi:hypothetical protein